MTPPARTAQQRKADTLRRLENDVDTWVATADPATGTPYLVPLSFLWDGATVLICHPGRQPDQPQPAGHGQGAAGHRPHP